MNVKRMLYYGLIYPLLEYGIVVWGQGAKTNIYPSKKGCKIYGGVKTAGIM
jgi:hypothetical protein